MPHTACCVPGRSSGTFLSSCSCSFKLSRLLFHSSVFSLSSSLSETRKKIHSNVDIMLSEFGKITTQLMLVSIHQTGKGYVIRWGLKHTSFSVNFWEYNNTFVYVPSQQSWGSNMIWSEAWKFIRGASHKITKALLPKAPNSRPELTREGGGKSDYSFVDASFSSEWNKANGDWGLGRKEPSPTVYEYELAD